MSCKGKIEEVTEKKLPTLYLLIEGKAERPIKSGIATVQYANGGSDKFYCQVKEKRFNLCAKLKMKLANNSAVTVALTFPGETSEICYIYDIGTAWTPCSMTA